MRADEVFAAFVAAINGHDVSGLAALMARDIVFVDSLGNGVSGPQKMEAGWRGYFAMCPDYSIRVDHVVADGDVVLAIGEAGGTIDGVAWKTPSAWKAVIRDDRVAEWRVFADNKPVYEILARR
jgi:ketosteroid isomerase-like protein